MGSSETYTQGWKHSEFREVTESNRSTWSASFFLCSPFSQLEGDVVGTGVEIQGFLFFMELMGDARRARQQHFEEVIKDVTVFQRDEGTFQKNTEVFLPGM